MRLQTEYEFYCDPGHAWLRVPCTELLFLGVANQISPCSYVRGGWAYLEEDRDAGIFLEAREAKGEFQLEEVYFESDAPCREYDHCSHSSISCSASNALAKDSVPSASTQVGPDREVQDLQPDQLSGAVQ